MMIPYVTTYIEFDMHRKEEVKHAIERATIVAKKIKKKAVVVTWLLILLSIVGIPKPIASILPAFIAGKDRENDPEETRGTKNTRVSLLLHP